MYLDVKCEGCHRTLIARVVDNVLMVAKCKTCPDKPTPHEAWKRNVLNIAKDHKEHCTVEHCGCNLHLLKLMAEAAGVVFNGTDFAAFL